MLAPYEDDSTRDLALAKLNALHPDATDRELVDTLNEEAMLIAAAPELLAACIALKTSESGDLTREEWLRQLDYACKLANAAIRKATGAA